MSKKDSNPDKTVRERLLLDPTQPTGISPYMYEDPNDRPKLPLLPPKTNVDYD